MKRTIMLSTLTATMALMLALAGSASAVKPQTEPVHAEVTQFFVTDCGAFQVLDDFTIDGVITTFYDSAGNADYYRAHFTFRDFFYNSETGEGFTAINHSNPVFDLPSDTEVTSSGLSYHVTVPGGGLLLLDAGRVEFDEAGNPTFVAGPHQVLSGDTEKLCKALA
jgi:hypothetical protein